MKSNTRYVNYKSEAERGRLTGEYEILGYYVTSEGGRLKVSSKFPKKVEKAKPKFRKR